MRLATKAATVLALASLTKSQRARESVTEQADAALALMADGTQGPMANAVLDSAVEEAMRALHREGWKTDHITHRVNQELRNAGIEPTCKGSGHA